ncbi:MAG: hypothetical protein JNM62_14775 [Flavobacteriales bacterium]|nr:hypothetical protein [Flavobacteriales bacterium]
MRRLFACLVLLILGVVHLAPLAVLVQFHVDRAHIEQELCVQREVMAEMRTCHGECQLSKRFKVLERSAEQEFPMKRIESRYEPLVDLTEGDAYFEQGSFVLVYPELIVTPIDRTVPASDPVPWA